MNYIDGKLFLSGQHEDVILVRSDGKLELIDTFDLGFPIGLESNIEEFIDQKCIELNKGDTLVLYTDGVTEAENNLGEQYGIENLCGVVKRNIFCTANEIKETILKDLNQHIGESKVMDDITLIVLKKR